MRGRLRSSLPVGEQLCREAQLYRLLHVPVLGGKFLLDRARCRRRARHDAVLCRRVITVIISRLLHFQVMTLILVICTTALHLVLLSHKSHMSFRHAIATSQGVGSAIAFCLSIILIWPVSALLSYHLRVSRSQCAPASSNEVTDSVDRTAAPAQRYHDRTGTCCVRSPMCPRACAVIVRGPCRRPAISDIALTD